MNSCFLMCLGYLPISDAWSWRSEGGVQVPVVPSSSARCKSHHLCSVVALQQRRLVLPFLLQRMEMCGDPETPALLQGRVCVSLHHCLADEKGACIPLLLLPWLSWEWISVSFSVCLLVKEVGTFPFLSTFACSLLTLVRVGYFFLVPVGCLGYGWVHL